MSVGLLGYRRVKQVSGGEHRAEHSGGLREVPGEGRSEGRRRMQEVGGRAFLGSESKIRRPPVGGSLSGPCVLRTIGVYTAVRWAEPEAFPGGVMCTARFPCEKQLAFIFFGR